MLDRRIAEGEDFAIAAKHDWRGGDKLLQRILTLGLKPSSAEA